jgi:hypothetical protein
MNNIYLSMDLATTAGFAINIDNTIFAFEITEQNPIKQLHRLIDICISNNFEFNKVIAENFVYFGGFAKAQASLLKRLGYFQYSIEWCGCEFELLNLSTVRKTVLTYHKQFIVKGKKPKLQIRDLFRQFNSKLSDNHTDAIAMIMQYDAKGIERYTYEIIKH